MDGDRNGRDDARHVGPRAERSQNPMTLVGS